MLVGWILHFWQPPPFLTVLAKNVSILFYSILLISIVCDWNLMNHKILKRFQLATASPQALRHPHHATKSPPGQVVIDPKDLELGVLHGIYWEMRSVWISRNMHMKYMNKYEISPNIYEYSGFRLRFPKASGGSPHSPTCLFSIKDHGVSHVQHPCQNRPK